MHTLPLIHYIVAHSANIICSLSEMKKEQWRLRTGNL